MSLQNNLSTNTTLDSSEMLNVTSCEVGSNCRSEELSPWSAAFSEETVEWKEFTAAAATLSGFPVSEQLFLPS